MLILFAQMSDGQNMQQINILNDLKKTLAYFPVDEGMLWNFTIVSY